MRGNTMARLGMDADAVEQAGRDLKARATDIGNLLGQIDRIVNGLTSIWDGQDSQTFVSTTWPQHKRALQQVQTEIDTLGQTAQSNATEQRQVSGR